MNGDVYTCTNNIWSSKPTSNLSDMYPGEEMASCHDLNVYAIGLISIGAIMTVISGGLLANVLRVAYEEDKPYKKSEDNKPAAPNPLQLGGRRVFGR
jgi:hypothetical protein